MRNLSNVLSEGIMKDVPTEDPSSIVIYHET